MASVDAAYLEDCHQMRQSIAMLQTLAQNVFRELDNEGPLDGVRDSIDSGIGRISELHDVLKRFQDYVYQSQTMKNQRKFVYKQFKIVRSCKKTQSTCRNMDR